LIDYFFEKDREGNYHSRKEGWQWHLISWLPFAGNIVLDKKKYQKRPK